jgi:adenine-specific DNA-methyltransferase
MAIVNNLIKPVNGERPTIYADRLGHHYTSYVSDAHKEEIGQVMTPIEVADFMSSLLVGDLSSVKMLDPGAGSGVLSCALCERIINSTSPPKTISLVAYESDHEIFPFLKASYDYLKQWLLKEDVNLEYIIRTEDFVLSNAGSLDYSMKFDSECYDRFDFIISNPPYFKIPKTDRRAKAAAAVVHGQPNIYAIFMAISARLLKNKGQLVFITPRSFTAGPYFRLFRERFFSIIRPKNFHIFESRTDAFDRDSVLQENIILAGVRDDNWFKDKKIHYSIISLSHGLKDLCSITKREVKTRDVIDLNSVNKFLCLPLSDEEEDIIKLINSWNENLHTYGMEISTGPVVPFRARTLIDNEGKVPSSHAPLLWMQNVKEMSVSWPLQIKKEQYIKKNTDSKSLLIDDKNYVLMRRFSAKEDNKRLVTAPYFAGSYGSEFIGLENHLNYIYKLNGNLNRDEAIGLSALLNCRLIDIYFRAFNGNTQVSATEIRDMPLPPSELISEIGRYIGDCKMSNGELDKYISDLLIGRYGKTIKRNGVGAYG